jgi:hypothetical protein
MGIKSYISLGAVSLAVLAGADSAQAAALQGRVGINPPSPVPGGEGTGVRFIGTGLTVPGTDFPATDFDFLPPAGGGIGPVVELNANPLNGENDFLPFVGFTGSIQDITAAQIFGIVGGATLPDFINIPGAFSVTLTDVENPEYTFDGGGTTVSLGVTGDFINLSDGSGDVSFGVGTFSVDFAGLTIAETQALFDEPGEIPTDFDPGTWSSNFEVVAEVPTEVVPEASNLLGLFVIGLGGATVLARKKAVR